MPLPPDSVSVMDPYPDRVGIAANIISFIRVYVCRFSASLHTCVCACVGITTSVCSEFVRLEFQHIALK